MIDVERYISRLTDSLLIEYGSRLVYVGLQGSYLRGEATENSDIDIVVVIDKLDVEDLERYRSIIQSMEAPAKSCGFICSKDDIAHWNPLEIHHLLNCTKDYYGALNELVPDYTEVDIRNFIKLSLNNLYHEICHRFVHSADNQNLSKLAGAYKGVFFILQNLYFLQHGVFVATKSELLSLLNDNDYAVLKRANDLDVGFSHDFQDCFELLFKWCQDTLKSL